MKFEYLPNEIIIDCLEYLNVFDIFHSFDQLNFRLNKLIRNIPIHINFEDVRKRLFDQFSRKILSNPEIQRQIYSLRLSNRNTCHQIDAFLSVVSPNEFSNLRSLKLIQIEKKNVTKLQSIISSASKLFSFDLISTEIDEDEIVPSLPMDNLRRLSMLSLRSFLKHIEQTTFITHLTIYNCSLEQLSHQLFKYVPQLKYLNIAYLVKYNRSISIDKSSALHLEQLIIGEFKYKLEDFLMFVKQTPNLKSLTISASDNKSMINAFKWKDLFTDLLPLLNIFKFKFGCSSTIPSNMIPQIYSSFRQEFRVKPQFCNVEFMSLTRQTFYIYSNPYLSNTLQLESDSFRISINRDDKWKTFDNVINLTLNDKQITVKCSFRFSNVISLKLVNTEQEIIDPSNLFRYIEYLKLIVNLSNLKHLNISLDHTAIPSGKLLQILKEASQITSIKIDPNDLTLLLNQNQLCQYANKMIQNLDVYKYNYPSFNNLCQLKKFCKVFSNIRQIRCNTINEPKYVFFLLHRLFKLSNLYAYLPSLNKYKYIYSLLKNYASMLNFNSTIKGNVFDPRELYIWIDRNNN